jgi:hypothetical protein
MKNHHFTTTIIALVYVLGISSAIALLTMPDAQLTLGFKLVCWTFVTIAAYRMVAGFIFMYKNRGNIPAARKQFIKDNLSKKEIAAIYAKFKDQRALNLNKKYHQYSFGHITIEAKKNNDKNALRGFSMLTPHQQQTTGYYLMQGNQIDQLIPKELK